MSSFKDKHIVTFLREQSGRNETIVTASNDNCIPIFTAQLFFERFVCVCRYFFFFFLHFIPQRFNQNEAETQTRITGRTV